MRIKKRIFRHKTIETLTPYLFLTPSLILITLIVAFPIAYNLYISLFDWNLRSAVKPFVGFGNYLDLLKKPEFIRVVVNTVIWTVLGVFLQMIIGLALAIFIQGRKRSQGLLRSIIIFPWIMPGVVVCLIWSWMLQADMGIINNVLSSLGIAKDPILWLSDSKFALGTVIVVNTWKAFPFWFLMILASLQSLSLELLEASRIDGATKFKEFIHIKIPHLIPVISATGVITTMWTLNYFDLIYLLTRGGPDNATATLPVYTYQLGFSFFKFGEASAMAIISLLVIIILSLPYIRMMFKNLEDGGMD